MGQTYGLCVVKLEGVNLRGGVFCFVYPVLFFVSPRRYHGLVRRELVLESLRNKSSLVVGFQHPRFQCLAGGAFGVVVIFSFLDIFESFTSFFES